MVLMNISLALSGGGVKGFAHIGVLRVLEKNGFHIRGVSGTSAGGLVGALYAAGYSPDEMESSLRDIDQSSLFTHMHGEGPALLGFAGAAGILYDLLGDRTFDELRLPLAVTATDLNTGLPVVIKQGKLIDAVLATSAMPGVFPARENCGHIFVDGGLMNPVPIAEARALFPHGLVIAVVLAPPLGWQVDANLEHPESFPLLMTNIPLVYRLAGRLRLAQAFRIFIQSMDLTGQMLLDKQLKLEKPDVIIRPKVVQIGLIDLVNIPEVIKLGEQAAMDSLPDIHKVSNWQHRLKRRISQVMTR